MSLRLAYLKVEIVHNLASALDAFTEGRTSKAIKLTKRALELMEKYERILEEVR